MPIKYNFSHNTTFSLNDVATNDKNTEEATEKYIHAQKKSRIFYFKLTLLLNFQWLYIHPFSQLQTASDGKK